MVFDKDVLEQQIYEQIDYERLEDLSEHLKHEIETIFNSCGLYFRIFYRIKTPESIAAKIMQRGYGTEENPRKLQDLIGFRVVLYYHDDLKICRDVVESTFQMIDTWSTFDFNPNEFKATKINGVFRFPEEYFQFYTKDLWTLPIDTTFEIQFRTMFFEGWHEIEHDMRYKSRLTDEEFWQGSAELARTLNCVLANLELSDWSMVKLFEELGYNHYKNKNWPLMLKSHFRIRIVEEEPLDSRIIKLFDENHPLAKAFYKCSRHSLIQDLLKGDQPYVNYNLIVKLINENTIHDPTLQEICQDISLPKKMQRKDKIVLTPLLEQTLFQLTAPLLHKETRELTSEFASAAATLYRWCRYKIGSVFTDMPENTSPYDGNIPGYFVHIDHRAEQMYFTMKVRHIDYELPGTTWEVCAFLAPQPDGKILFSTKTKRFSPEHTVQKTSFSKPSFLTDLSTKVGITDVCRLGTKAQIIETLDDYEDFVSLMQDKNRTLPLVLIQQSSEAISKSIESDSDRTGYDMDTFTINGTRLAKVVGLYCHVYMMDHEFLDTWKQLHDLTTEQADGCIMIYWPSSSGREPELYTQKTVSDSQFDFNRAAYKSGQVYEKAFRHKLVQRIKTDNTILK